MVKNTIIIGVVVCLISSSAYSWEYDVGDINRDRYVNMADFAYLASDWQTSAVRSDIVPDGIVDLLDLTQLAEDWLKSITPEVALQITGAVNGTIVIKLYGDQAPVTVENFLNYVQTGFYDGLIFHRVIPGFIVQGGGFDTDFVKKTPNAPIINESSNRLSNLRGTIAMARTPYPHSATSEFFINHVDNTPGNLNDLDYTPFLYDLNDTAYSKYGYCVFGKVLSGMDVVDAIAALPTTDERPDDNVIIQSAIITQDVPVCAEKLEGDVDGNCSVNLADFAKLAKNWLACNSITAVCN